VRTIRRLDRERQSSYTLLVTATDGGGPAVTAELSVVVQDVNDNRPTMRCRIISPLKQTKQTLV